MSLGENVKRARMAKNWSAERLAREVQCSAATIERLERDEIPGSVLRLAAIADAVGLSVDRLLGS